MVSETNNNLFAIASNRMFSALNSFYIWKKFNQSININEDGGEVMAQENLDEIFNKYKYFFQQTLISSYKTFILDLTVFFESEKFEETFSIGKLVKIIEDSGVDVTQLKVDIQKIKFPHGKIIGLIMKLRNQDVAHQAKNPEQHVLVYTEVEALFKAVQAILNAISIYYDNSVSAWSHVEDEIVRDVDRVFENLKRGEKVRLAEISDKWDVKS